MLAELWGVLRGLEMAWEAGWRHVVVESDCQSVIALLSKQGNTARKSYLVSQIRAMTRRKWVIRYNHVLREGNQCADWLANFTLMHVKSPDKTHFSNPSTSFHYFLVIDLVGVHRERRGLKL